MRFSTRAAGAGSRARASGRGGSRPRGRRRAPRAGSPSVAQHDEADLRLVRRGDGGSRRRARATRRSPTRRRRRGGSSSGSVGCGSARRADGRASPRAARGRSPSDDVRDTRTPVGAVARGRSGGSSMPVAVLRPIAPSPASSAARSATRACEARARHDLVDELPLDRALAAHALGRRREEVGVVAPHAALVDDPREPARAGQHAEERDLGQRDRRRAVVDEQDLVAGERELVAAARGGAVQRAERLRRATRGASSSR